MKELLKLIQEGLSNNATDNGDKKLGEMGIVTLGAGYQLLEKGKSDWKNR